MGNCVAVFVAKTLQEMNFKIPRTIRMLTQYGADALRPCMFQGRYIKPLVSRRVAADLRKRSIIEGTFGSFVPNEGGWDPTWDLQRKMYILKPNKGHLRERTRETRANKITTAMAGMPARVSKYEQEMQARKPKKDLYYFIKRAKELATKY